MADNVTLPGTGSAVAADDISSVWYQRFKRSAGADGTATDFLDQKTTSDNYTTTATGTTADVNVQGMANFSLQCKGTGATPTSWTILLEGSNDNTNFTTLITHTNTVYSDGITASIGPVGPFKYYRTRCTAITLGGASNIVATVVASPYAGGNTVEVSGLPRKPTASVLGSHVALAVQVVGSTGGQVTSFGAVPAAVTTASVVCTSTDNAQNIKASAGTLRAVRIQNTLEFPIKVTFHNTAGTPTAGASVLYPQVCQAGEMRDVVVSGGGRTFGTGIGLCVVQATTSLADAVTTALGTPNKALVTVEYE